MLDDRRCIFEEFLFEVTWDKHHLRMQRQEGAAAGQPTACVTMQRAALQAGAHTEEEEEEEAGKGLLHSMLSAVLPHGVPLGTLTLRRCDMWERSFVGCSALLAAVTTLRLVSSFEI